MALAVKWQLDPAHTLVAFAVKHMMFTTVRGRFKSVQGELLVDQEAPNNSYVHVSIDARTIDTGVEARDAHLRSADFLDVANHPEITFVSTRVVGASLIEGKSFQVVGELRIRGIPIEVVLDTVFQGTGRDPWGGLRAGFAARCSVDRREWGLMWNTALEAGGILVGNTVDIEVHAQTILQEQPKESVGATPAPS